MGSIIVLIVLIILNAFFAASEIALVSLNDNMVRRQAEQDDKKAILLAKLLEEPGRFLATIQIGITLAGFLASAFAADTFATPLAERLANWGVPLSIATLNTLSVVVITILLSYFTLVIGELVPKQLALQKAETIARFVAKPVTLLFKISLPIVVFLNASTNFIVKLFGVDPNSENEEATEEEIRLMVDLGGERGTIEKAESLMIHNIFEFNDKDVSDIMTHRINMSAIELQTTLSEVVSLIKENRFTRYPVFDDTIDHIVGILHTKDLIPYITADCRSFSLANVIRKPYFVLESKPVDHVLKEMQQLNIHIAIIIDEYGGTHGLVTIEDLIEEIVGEISSEHGEEEKHPLGIESISAHEAIVQGDTHLYDFNHFFDVELPTERYETVNGFLVDQIGYIPTNEKDAQVNYQDLIFTITKSTNKRIEEVNVKRKT
ncbi:hemolysin family protein [Amphibacillus sediminis]|uniref:hemolysin family protein n=1 Tax=Amphibacillus sediminis TaxID=360185 RepID=UPI0008367CE6|nr:hemolysin family protein [Amphibacillus sediminis]